MLKEFSYHCHQIVSCTQNISIITLVPEAQKIHYLPGQYVEAVLKSGDLLSLSIANIPNKDGHLELHIRHDAYHPLAQQWMIELNQNKNVRLYGPKGNCTLQRAKAAKNLILVAGGTGFGPINALLVDALKEKDKSIELFWGIRRPEDAYKATLLQQWQDDFSFFSYNIVLSEPEYFLFWQGPTGLVHEYVAKKYPCFREEYVFASGPYPMVKAARLLFCQQGLAPDKFISDILFPV